MAAGGLQRQIGASEGGRARARRHLAAAALETGSHLFPNDPEIAVRKIGSRVDGVEAAPPRCYVTQRLTQRCPRAVEDGGVRSLVHEAMIGGGRAAWQVLRLHRDS